MVEAIAMVISAALAAVASAYGSYMVGKKNRQTAKTENALREQAQNIKLEAIEKKLDIHNGYAEKFGEISMSIKDIQKDTEITRKEIEYLKEKVAKVESIYLKAN